MITLFILSFILITFIIENNIVSSGATYGLMLWYQNVLPLLLPFMLISGLIEAKIKEGNTSNSAKAICVTLFLGLLCGYPIGAKTTAAFVKDNIYKKSTGNLLLPLCNNISPMFLSGYIAHIILRDNLPIYIIIILIFSPYLIYFLFAILVNYLMNHSINTLNHLITHASSTSHNISNHLITHTSSTSHNTSINSHPHKNADLVEMSITQITYVGFYIMLCSIGIELILNTSFISHSYKLIIAGILEITRGTDLISSSFIFSENIKTALIIALTSFGGISSILQTGKVIQQSGLSLFYYVVIKLLCSIMSFYLTLLLI